ncbi:helix-turn-helix domain-containing protein [Legionella sp. PATHC035]|uniref:helix-turn-helix domain-containing protein n=1 Tax=Legionella sp. PATHC035 TaxID=2992040 RepID=UPI002242CC9D|nr:helix-turn-helix domain-containing protein [Legionella sp. PATHC035]MCW8408860.1 helix-turn-helix domain-containing protein [Legionella sp. PATHC035]
MSDPVNQTPPCSNCGFFPFCTLEEGNPHWINQISSAVKQQHVLKKKQALYFPQNTFHSLYAIKSGTLKTFEVDSEGNELIRGFYFAGEILGFEAIASGTYLFSAVALSETVVCEIPYHHFTELLNSNSSLQKHILYLISQKLTVGSYLNFVTAEQRLAAFLVDLFKRLHGCEQQMELVLPMSRQDIGNYLGLTAETVSRLFSQFKKNKMISIEQKKVQLLQVDQLKLIAGIVN